MRWARAVVRRRSSRLRAGARPRIPRSSRSASSPKRPSRSSSSSLAATPPALLADLVEGRRDVLLALGVGVELDDALERRVDRRRRRAEGAGDEAPHLVDDDEVAARREDVDDRLRGEHLADRRRERRPARLRADPVELLEHLVEPVVGAFRLQRVVDPGDDARRQVVARREHGDARHERSHELVADVLVDEVGRLPERVDVDAGVEPDAAERLRERLARDAVQGQRERVDRAGDELRARPAPRRASPRARCRRLPGRRSRRAGRSPRRARRTSSSAVCGCSEPVGSWRRTRTAPSSGSIRARSISVSISPVRPGL